MRTKKQALFHARIIILACFIALLFPIFTCLCMILTIIELKSPIKMELIQKIHGEVGVFGLIAFVVVFAFFSILFFVIASFLISGGFAHYKKMKRCSWKCTIIENF